jgi:hypothetical protein
MYMMINKIFTDQSSVIRRARAENGKFMLQQITKSAQCVFRTFNNFCWFRHEIDIIYLQLQPALGIVVLIH